MFGSRRLFILMFATFWSAITGLFVFFALSGIIGQWRSQSFVPVRATIDSIKQTESHDSHGTSYGVAVAYHYTVDGKRYDSTRLRFGQMSSSDGWAEHMVQQYRPRSHPTAYVDPANPASAVLQRGPDGMDYFLLMFLTPFVLVGVGLWIWLGLSFRRRTTPEDFGILETPTLTRVRPSWAVVPAAALGGLGLAAFLTLFPIAFLSADIHAAMGAVRVGWVVVLCVSVAAGIVTGVLRARGAFDITYDEAKQVLVVRRQTIPASAMQSLYVRESVQSKGPSLYAIDLKYTRDNIPATLTLRDNLPDADTAARLAVYLSLRMHCPALTGAGVPVLSPAAG